MNFKLWAVASVALSLSAGAGCIVSPNPVTSGGLGGDDTGGSNASTGEGSTGTTGTGSGTTTAGSGLPSGAARMFYINTVHPLLVSANDPAASCTACHVAGQSGAPMFMADDANTSYDMMDKYSGLITKPADSQLLLHGKHTGPALSVVQKDNVTQWLTMEAQERGLDMPTGTTGMMPPPISVADAFAQVGKCMVQTDWDANNLDLLAKAQTFSTGPCGACHSAGEGGMYLDVLDPTTTFTMQKGLPYVKRWFKAEYVNGAFTGKLLPNPRVYLKGDTLPPCDPKTEICHPKYILAPTLKTDVDNFINLTLTRMNTNACAP